MSQFEALLGAELMGEDGSVKTSDVLAGKTHVMIYFSAHWCPPCRVFTPRLATAYKEKTKNVEIVFLSSDRDEAAFSDYFGEMPWLALPYCEREKKEELSTKYGVRGIPSLIILDGEGNLVTKEGRGGHAEYLGYEKKMPVPASWSELLGDELVGKAGNTKTEEALASKKHVMLYFSAHWCPPCRTFTPELAKAYENKTEDTEIVFISADRDQTGFDEYYQDMPWMALPFTGREKVGKIAEDYDVSGIPTLVVLDKDRKFVCSGRNYQKFLGGEQ